MVGLLRNVVHSRHGSASRAAIGLAVLLAIVCAGPGTVLASSSVPRPHGNRPQLASPDIGLRAPGSKASRVAPGGPIDLLGGPPQPSAAMVKPDEHGTRATASVAATDATAPTGPTQVTASSQSLITLNAQWSGAQDPDSGISYYIYGIGTLATGTYATLANVKWWQVTYDTSFSINMPLDSLQTYYVSVYAVNGAGIGGPIVTSNAVHPAWVPLGQTGNTMQIQFGSTGYDASGNPTTGFTSAQIATMSSFYSKMYPILVQLYGPPAVSYTVTIVRDLRYQSSNEFFPSTDEIRMSDTFYPQLFTHELLHAFRNDYLLSSDANWQYDATLSGFEEGFAQAVSYEAMNVYVQDYPNDSIVPGNTLWGSTYDWDYDFQNVPELRGTNFWSDDGGTLLHWTRYEMAAAAIRKLNIESPGFYARFNQEYYRRINANPTTVRPTQALIVDIIQTLVPTVEGMPAATWVAKQNIFYDQNVYGYKIFHQIQDYPWTQFFAFQKIFFLDTMACGSEWACYDGTQWVYYALNGSQGTGKLVDDDGNTVWSGPLQIQPTTNPSDGTNVIGYATKGLTTATTLQPWPGGSDSDYVEGLTALRLYRFDTTFTDPTGAPVTNSVYRVLGSAIANDFHGVWGGVIGHKNGTIWIDHDGYPAEAGIPVVNSAFAGTRAWTGVPDARTGGIDSVPGKVTITFTDSDTGATYHAERDIDYGSSDGSQMFLFNWTSGGDTTGPSVSVSTPAGGATVSGSVALSATASDPSGVAGVQFQVDGATVGSSTTAPYTYTWDSTSLPDGAHSVRAVATDSLGNTTVSAAVSITTANAAPTVSVTSPAGGAVVTGTVPVSIAAAASSGISKVELYRDGTVLVGSTSTSPYSVSWSTAGLAQGTSHTLTAKAYAVNGSTTLSAPITVAIKDTTAPAVSISAPSSGATITTTTTISATASDNVGVARVEIYVDGTLLATDTGAPYSASWNPATATLGSHTLTAKAYDGAGNATTSGSVSVKVADTHAPTVAVTSPTNGSTVGRGSTVTIAATSSDDRGVAKVTFTVNNVLKCTDTSVPYSCSWAVPSQRGVTYTIVVKAYDAANNVATVTVKVTSR